MIKQDLNSRNYDMGILNYRKMRQFGVKHDGFTLPLINQLYMMIGCDVLYGNMIHCVGMQMGFCSDVYFCNTLIGFYAKCGCVSFAQQLFEEMRFRDVVSWTSLISCYVSEGEKVRAFDLFNEMRRSEVEPNFVTVITMLQACVACESVVVGKELHGYVLKGGFLDDLIVRNSVLQMYAKKGTSEDVEMLFSESCRQDVVCWNILISFYQSVGNVEMVVEIFHNMLRVVKPGVDTLTLVASALSDYGGYAQGQQLHCFALKSGLWDDIFVTSLLGIYAKFGCLDDSIRLFGDTSRPASATWSSLMSAYTEHGRYDQAIGLFRQAQAVAVEARASMIKELVKLCTETGALHKGKEVHGFYFKNLFRNTPEIDSSLETSILNMYIRCGSISFARLCFHMMVEKDIVAWTSMIEGLGTYGLGLEALSQFDEMLRKGIEPNDVTFLSILSACSHAGLTNEGCELLYAMKWKFGIKPELNHYTCIVDLLGRSGKLREALSVLLKMVVYPDSRIWGALLAASSIHMNQRIGDYAARQLLELEPDNIGYQIVLSNMQASSEQWANVEELRSIVTSVNSKKLPGWSSVEVGAKVNGFVSGDGAHPNVDEVYELLGFLSRHMKSPYVYC